MPRKIALSIGTGALIGVVEVIFAVAFAALLFKNLGAESLANGIGLIILGTIPSLLLPALLGSYKGYCSLTQDAPAVIMALVTASIASQLTGANATGRFITVAAAVALTTVLTGLLLIVVGQFKLGSLVRFLPYPAVGGFLAGTGWLLLIGGIEFMADVPVAWSNVGALMQADVLMYWLPGVLAAIGMMWLINRLDNFLALPGLLVVLMLLFYAVALLSGASVAQLREQSWLIGPFTHTRMLQSLAIADVYLIDWSLIAGQFASLASVMLISLASALLNISGIELVTRRDLNLNRDLRVTGLSNVLAGFLGGAVSYPAVSTTALNHKISGGSAVIPVVAAAVFALQLFWGLASLSFVPKIVIGALLVVFGLSFLYEWVFRAWSKFSKLEYAIVVLIVVSIATLGFLPGVGVGLVAAVALFVVNYSRVSVTEHALSGVEVKSRIARTPAQRSRLNALGHQTHVLKLHGYIFFGTAHSLFEDVRKRVEDTQQAALRFLILDFEKVSGLDSSAMLSLAKMKQMLETQRIRLIVSGPNEMIRQQFMRERFVGVDPSSADLFPDLDHGMEWVENQLLGAEAQALSQPASLRSTIAQLMPNAVLLDALFGFLERRQVAAGEYLIRQAEPATGVYFIESGQVTAQLEFPDKAAVRLESMGAGHVVGELGFYLGQPRTAAVVADAPSVVYALSANSLARMEATAPEVASYFHRLIIQLLAARTTHLIRVVEALEK